MILTAHSSCRAKLRAAACRILSAICRTAALGCLAAAVIVLAAPGAATAEMFIKFDLRSEIIPYRCSVDIVDPEINLRSKRQTIPGEELQVVALVSSFVETGRTPAGITFASNGSHVQVRAASDGELPGLNARDLGGGMVDDNDNCLYVTFEAVAVDAFRLGDPGRSPAEATNVSVPRQTVEYPVVNTGIISWTFPDYEWVTYGSGAPESVFSIRPVTGRVSEGTSVIFEGDSGATPVTFMVTRGGDARSEASITWQIALDSDTINDLDVQERNIVLVEPEVPIRPVSQSLRFAAGQASANITLNVVGDAQPEQNESLTLRLIRSSIGVIDANKNQASVSVLNDDGAFTYSNVARHFLNKALQRASAEDTLFNKLENARRFLLEERDRNSTDTVLRDAERYILGVNAGSTTDTFLTGYVLYTDLYEGLKALMIWANQGESMRADPTRPNSAPGGAYAAYHGLMDGALLRNGCDPDSATFSSATTVPAAKQQPSCLFSASPGKDPTSST